MNHKLIVFTMPEFFEGEVEQITDLFEAGLPILHLRKPTASKEEIVHILKQIPSQFLEQVTIHDHFDLTDQFPIGGVHLNSRNKTYSGRGKIRISKSLHSFEELLGIDDQLSYVTLSPIFDSISKQGYNAAFGHDDLLSKGQSGIINEKVVALGGVNYDNVKQLPQYRFGGAAMLGNVWQNFDPTRFKECLDYVQSSFI